MSEVFLDVALRSGYEKTPGGAIICSRAGFFLRPSSRQTGELAKMKGAQSSLTKL